MLVLDVTDDQGASLVAFTSQTGLDSLPETVKTAQWLEPAKGHDRDFALILIDADGSSHRKYACHDPGNTIVSMFYLDQARDQLNPAAVKVAAANLASAANDWGLVVPIEIEKMAAASLSEGAARDVVDERRVHFHPQRVGAATTTAQGPFAKLASATKSWHDLTPAQRRAAALDLTKEAETVPLVVPQEVFRYSGTQLSSKFAAHMQTRIAHCSDPECVDGYNVLSKTASLFAPDNVVEALYTLDEAAHLRWAGGDRYSQNLVDPILAVYDRIKEAAYTWSEGAEHVTEHDLVMFRMRPSAQSYFTSTFTDDLWAKFDRDPVGTFKNLPREQKVLLSRLARAE